MANKRRRLERNAPGDFFVDDTCINCGACRFIAPDSFDYDDQKSKVYQQPKTGDQLRRAAMAQLACPTSSIGSEKKEAIREAAASFPDKIDGAVYHCGFHSKKSFGATSYFIKRADGSVLVDSPRFVKALVKRLEGLGGVKYMFLTHKDDVADHRKFRDHFGLKRIIHRDDVTQELEDTEVILEGKEDVRIDEDIIFIPVPGHTKGSACMLYDQKYLFTGDHLYQNPIRDFPTAFVNHCWYDWDEQIRSMEKLAGRKFEWILPGHGGRVFYPADQMDEKMRLCVEWMKTAKK